MNEELHPECPIRNIIARFTDKWSLLILYTLNLHPVLRFNELRKEIPDISQKMLTTSLRTLFPHINSLIGWAKENMPAILKDRNTLKRKK